MDYKHILEKTYDIASINHYFLIDVKEGKTIYVSNEGGTDALYVLKQGEKIEVAERVTSVTQVKGGKLAYAHEVGKGRELHRVVIYDVERGDRVEVEHDPMRVFNVVFDGEVAVFSGVAEANSLYLVEGGRAEKLADLPSPLSIPSSVQGDLVAGLSQKMDGFSEIFFYDLKGRTLEAYTPSGRCNVTPPLLTEVGVLFASDHEGGDYRLYRMDLERKTLVKIHEGEVEYPFYDYREGKLLFIGKSQGRTRLYVDGTHVGTPEGIVYNAVLDGGRLYITYTNLVTPPSIYSLDRRWRKELGDDRVNLGSVEYHVYPSSDGVKIPAFVVKSASAEIPGPTVVYIHGGPWGEVDDSFHTFVAALALNGYHVIAPNFRGSTGYGEEFRMMNIGDVGGMDMEDIAVALSHFKDLISEAFAVGYSYGGYSTLMQLGKYPELWKAGVAGAPVTDWIDMYELSDAAFKGFIDMLMKGKRELMRERSPITYAEKVKAPVCIIAGQNDSRTPLRPVLRYVERLMNSGKTFEVHILPDAGHVPQTKQEVASILIPMILFLKAHTKSP